MALPGLSAPSSSWVREYTTGLPPTTIYAATEGSGVYRSVTNGVSWQSFSDGLQDIPGAMDVRTVYLDGLTVYAGTGAGLFKSVGWQLDAGRPGPGGRSEEPDEAQRLRPGALQPARRLAAGRRRQRRRLPQRRRRRDVDAAGPDNGMARSETVWSLGSFLGGVVYAATGSGVYRSLDNGATWTLASDGISGVILRVFADEKAPNIYYASGSDGVFRTINAGLTWSRIDGPPGHALGSGAVRALQQFTGVDVTRLYAGTPNGVYAGTTDHGPFPGEVRWRKLTTNGLGNNTIVWALKSFLNTPGTLLAGTQSNGGYALVLQPAVNSDAAVHHRHRQRRGHDSGRRPDAARQPRRLDRHRDDRVRLPVAALHERADGQLHGPRRRDLAQLRRHARGLRAALPRAGHRLQRLPHLRRSTRSRARSPAPPPPRRARCRAASSPRPRASGRPPPTTTPGSRSRG